jgi:hypothetical protein
MPEAFGFAADIGAFGADVGFAADVGGFATDVGGFATDVGGFAGDIGGLGADVGGFASDIGGFTGADIAGVPVPSDIPAELSAEFGASPIFTTADIPAANTAFYGDINAIETGFQTGAGAPDLNALVNEQLGATGNLAAAEAASLSPQLAAAAAPYASVGEYFGPLGGTLSPEFSTLTTYFDPTAAGFAAGTNPVTTAELLQALETPGFNFNLVTPAEIESGILGPATAAESAATAGETAAAAGEAAGATTGTIGEVAGVTPAATGLFDTPAAIEAASLGGDVLPTNILSTTSPLGTGLEGTTAAATQGIPAQAIGAAPSGFTTVGTGGLAADIGSIGGTLDVGTIPGQGLQEFSVAGAETPTLTGSVDTGAGFTGTVQEPGGFVTTVESPYTPPPPTSLGGDFETLAPGEQQTLGGVTDIAKEGGVTSFTPEQAANTPVLNPQAPNYLGLQAPVETPTGITADQFTADQFTPESGTSPYQQNLGGFTGDTGIADNKLQFVGQGNPGSWSTTYLQDSFSTDASTLGKVGETTDLGFPGQGISVTSNEDIFNEASGLGDQGVKGVYQPDALDQWNAASKALADANVGNWGMPPPTADTL